MRQAGYQRRRGGGSGSLRVTGGTLRGRRLRVTDVGGLRPTPERTRETLFNWLRGRIEGARVLDLFAGSGALAVEALSRGAADALLVERDPRAAAALRAACAELGLEGPGAGRARVLRRDALAWLARPTDPGPFDLVFLDPPFAAGLAAPALAALAGSALLAADARVYCERAAGDDPPWDASAWVVLRETRSGDSRAALLARAQRVST
jgi:16S rRNA (guanine966-N2)-methyltransferase